MQRIAAIFLSCWVFALGSGALAALHDLEHEHEDAAIAAADRAAGRPEHDAPHHDESNCPIHLQLQLPLITGGWAPLFVCLGFFVAFLTLFPARLVSYRSPLRLDCRGPPAC